MTVYLLDLAKILKTNLMHPICGEGWINIRNTQKNTKQSKRSTNYDLQNYHKDKKDTSLIQILICYIGLPHKLDTDYML